MIGRWNSCRLLNQSDTRLIPFEIFVFPRFWWLSFLVACLFLNLSFYRLLVTFAFILIGDCDHIAFGFTTNFEMRSNITSIYMGNGLPLCRIRKLQCLCSTWWRGAGNKKRTRDPRLITSHSCLLQQNFLASLTSSLSTNRFVDQGVFIITTSWKWWLEFFNILFQFSSLFALVFPLCRFFTLVKILFHFFFLFKGNFMHKKINHLKVLND